MPISRTPERPNFPYRGEALDNTVDRFMGIPTPADMKRRSLFGIPLRSFLTGDVIDDQTLQDYIDQSISELEHALDLYINPVEFDELHDYERHLQFWSFGYMKVDHAPINTVKKFQLTFNNGMTNGPDGNPLNVLVDIPLEYIHTQPQEGTVQLVPAQGVSISGFVVSIYSGLGYHAFNSQAISYWPGAIHIVYEAGFKEGKVPALLAGLIENIAAYKFLSSLGPILFPHNSVSIGIDGTSQSVGTLGPAYLQLRLKDLTDMIDKQMDIARGYYQKRFLVDAL